MSKANAAFCQGHILLDQKIMTVFTGQHGFRKSLVPYTKLSENTNKLLVSS